MNRGRPNDSQRPGWRWRLALKASAFVLYAVASVVGWLFGYPLRLAIASLAFLGLLLCAACWFGSESRREGLWQLADLVDTLAMPCLLWTVVFRDVSFGWWWLLAGPIVTLYAILVAVGLDSCFREIRHWPEWRLSKS